MASEETSSSEMMRLVVQFDLPFVLLAVDSIEQDARPDGYVDYTAAVGRFRPWIRLKKNVRQQQGAVRHLEDRRGHLSYSTVQVWFHRDHLEFAGATNGLARERDFFATAIMVVNQYLDAYREVTGKFWIHEVSAREIASHAFVCCFADGSTKTFHRGTLGTGQTLGALPPSLDDQIRSRLANGKVSDPIARYADTVRTTFNFSDFWATVMACGILFEALFARMLRNAFTAQGLTGSQIDNKFSKNNGIPHSVTFLVKNYVKLFGPDPTVAGTQLHTQFVAWCTNVRNRRNDVAHGKALTITKEEAEEALDATQGFLTELLKFMPDSALAAVNLDVSYPFKRASSSG